MLLTNLDAYKLEDCDLDESSFALLTEDSNGEGLRVFASVTVDSLGHVDSHVHSIEIFDSLGETFAASSRRDIENIEDLEVCLAGLVACEESVVDELRGLEVVS